MSTEVSSAAAEIVFKIPRVIKRNTVLLAISQAFVGTGMQVVPTVAPLLVVQLSNMLTLAGLPSTLTSASRFLVGYPLGRIMDAYGRRAGLLLGLGLALIGAVVVGASALTRSLPLLVAGILLFGMGMAAAQQLRLAAADMYPASRRAEGLGYVLSGSLLGALGAPIIFSFAEFLAPRIGMSTLSLPWFLLPVIILPPMALVFKMRPDPKEIAANMGQYYPGYVTAAFVVRADGARPEKMPFAKVVAFVASAAVQGNMIMMMAMTSIVLDHHGYQLPMISLSVAFHVIGMYGLSLPFGRLTDWFGRRNLIIVGLLVSVGGSTLMPLSVEYWIITLGGFLIGAGWSAVYVASTAVIADTTAPQVRGAAIGTNDTIANGAGMVLGLLGGVLVASFGIGSLAITAACVIVVPLVMTFRIPNKGQISY